MGLSKVRSCRTPRLPANWAPLPTNVLAATKPSNLFLLWGLRDWRLFCVNLSTFGPNPLSLTKKGRTWLALEPRFQLVFSLQHMGGSRFSSLVGIGDKSKRGKLKEVRGLFGIRVLISRRRPGGSRHRTGSIPHPPFWYEVQPRPTTCWSCGPDKSGLDFNLFKLMIKHVSSPYQLTSG